MRDGYRQQFDIGQRPMAELLAAERTLADARIDQFAAEAERWQIRPDGSPTPSRWSRALPRSGDLGFVGFVQALFKAPAGSYRVIAFVVTAAPRVRGGQPPLGEQRLRELKCAGWTTGLPASVRRIAIQADTKATALIYEFEKRDEAAPTTILLDGVGPARPHLDAEAHLKRAGIWPQLAATAAR